MTKKWLTMVCGICLAGMLAACGDAKEEIQKVEQENIATSQEENEKEAEKEQEVIEEPDKAAEDEEVKVLEKKPAVVTIEEEKQEYKDGDSVVFVTNYDKVTVGIEGNEAVAQAVMSEFKNRRKDFEEALVAEEVIEFAKENPIVDGTFPYYRGRGYTLVRNDGSILSFSTMLDGYEGGAHGYYMYTGLNFDAGTGKLLTIADIAKDKAAFQEVCVQEMLRQCEDLKAQGALFDDAVLTPSLQEILEAKMDGDEWYFTEKGIRFISNVYEIGPYAAGSFDFDIPYEMVNEALKEEYRG